MSPTSKTKKLSKTKKRSYIEGGIVMKAEKPKPKLCKTCWQDILKNEMRDMYMFHDTYHQLSVKDYCKEHETTHSDHKCKPVWCGDCGYLSKYEITIDHSKWDK